MIKKFENFVILENVIFNDDIDKLIICVVKLLSKFKLVEPKIFKTHVNIVYCLNVSYVSGYRSIMTIQLIDYYSGDLHKYFEFFINDQVKKEEIIEELYEPLITIEKVLKKYVRLGMIKYDHINNIISELTTEINLLYDSKKYNI